MSEDGLKTEQGISECYLEGVTRHSGSISGFIHINRLYWLSNDMKYPSGARELRKDIMPIPPPIEEVIAQAAESLADPNCFIAEISGSSNY
jgi:hypothetical protein